ncbi:MAG: hypothetical protein QOC56_596 [Alphaproteobacteria bacterium]|nr:hypothetical protein [Alphaproteobacteria bacterium]
MPATWCATPSARCWWCGSESARGYGSRVSLSMRGRARRAQSLYCAALRRSANGSVRGKPPIRWRSASRRHGFMKPTNQPQGRTHHRGRLLGAWAAQALRSGTHQQGADCGRSGRAHRCPVRHRARDQRHDAAGTVRVRHERSRPHLSSRWRPGCASSAPESARMAIPARLSITASSAGRHSRDSSTTVACACRTTQPSARCVQSP